MSSMDPMGGAPGYDVNQNEYASAGAVGVCNTCGSTMPPADLEAIAAGIDQTLSMETGKIVSRTAWAGNPPDGVVDALLSFMPGAKARRRIWERGQQLWAEQMTAAMSGPCAACQHGSNSYAPAATMMQTATDRAYDAAPQHEEPAPPSASPYDSGTAFMQPEPYVPTAFQGQPSPTPAPSYDDDAQEGKTTAFPSYQGFGGDGEPADDDGVTRAVPAFLNAAPPPSTPQGPAPTPEMPPDAPDDYESHTVMFTAPPSLRPTVSPSRLVVLEGPVHGRQFTMNRATTTIGRSIGCNVTVEDDSVAFEHARIVRGDDGWRLELAGEADGLFVNDDVVSGPRALRSGDVIRVGPARLRFETVS